MIKQTKVKRKRKRKDHIFTNTTKVRERKKNLSFHFFPKLSNLPLNPKIGMVIMEVGPAVVVNMGKVLDAEEDVGVAVAIRAAVVDGEGDMDLAQARVVR